MRLDQPLGVVTPTLDGSVLAVLARADHEYTAPRVRSMIGDCSVVGVRRVLQRLADEGVVDARVAGRTVSYALNREHLAAPAIIELADLRRRLIERIAETVSSWRVAPVVVALFGSAIAGPMRIDSDIDLFVVRSAGVDADDAVWRSQLVELEQSVARWTGNDARVLEYSGEEVAEHHDPVATAIRDGGIVVSGGWPAIGNRTEARR